MRPPERRVAGAALLGGILLLAAPPGDARAHGPAPAPLRVLRVSEGRADLIQTNIGLAIHSKDGIYRYGCPSLWGGLETPLMAATDDGDLFVVGDDALHASEDRACEAPGRGVEALRPLDVIAIAPAGDRRVLLLARDDDAGAAGSRLFAWTPEAITPLQSWTGTRFDSLLVDGERVVLAGARPAPSVWLGDRSGEGPWIEQTPALPEGVALQRLTARAWDGDTLHLAATAAEGAVWLRSVDGGATLELIAQAARSIHGPAPLCGGLFALVDNEPVPDPAHPPACDLSALAGQSLTCLGATGGVTWTCRLRALERVDAPDGAPAALTSWFTLDALIGPWPGCPADPVAQGSCQQDWLHYGGEAALIDPDDLFGAHGPDLPAEPPDSGAPDAGGSDAGQADAGANTPPPGSGQEGCAVADVRGRAAGPLALLMLLLTFGWQMSRLQRRGAARD